MGINRIWRRGKTTPRLCPSVALPLAAPGMQSGIMQTPCVTIPGFPWDSVLSAGSANHSQSPSRRVPALPNQDPKARWGLWESGPAESGQRGWSDSIDRNLIPNWLQRRTPARPGFELPGRTNRPVSAGFWEAGSMHPCSLLVPHRLLLHPALLPWAPSQQEGSEPCGAASDPVSPAQQLLPGVKSTPRPSASTCRFSRLSSELSGHPGDARRPGAFLPAPTARPSLWSQAPP